MPRVTIPFAREYSARIAKTISNEKLINLYSRPMTTHNKERYVLQQRPGLVVDEIYSIGPHRGSLVHADSMYFVSSNAVYMMESDGTTTRIGSIYSYTGRVGMASNGTELIIVDGLDGWIWNSSTGTWTRITDADFVDAQQVVFYNGRFVVIRPNTGEFYISALYDGFTWGALDFANAEVDPDDAVSLIVLNQHLWIFGEYTTQAFVDTGNPTFPYEAQSGGMMEWGIAAKWSVAKADNGVVWLGKTRDGHGNVLFGSGMIPKVISTPALEEAITRYERIDDAFAFVVKPNDMSIWYVLTFPSGNATWVYDFATGLWHQWSHYGDTEFKAATHCFFRDTHFMGSSTDGTLYQFDDETYADGDDPMERVVVSVHQTNEQNRIFWKSVELLCDSGQGLSSGQGSDPQAMMRWSDDGGYTWSNSHWRSIGKIGEYSRRAIWRRLGVSRHRVFEVRISDPVPVTLIGMYGDVQQGGI